MDLLRYILSGNTFFPGCALVIAGTIFSYTANKKVLHKWFFIFFIIIGLILIMIAGMPLNPLIFNIMAISMITLYALLSFESRITAAFIHTFRILLIFCSLYGVYSELECRIIPQLPNVKMGKVYVLGNSFNPPVKNPEIKTWPDILREKHDIKIFNISSDEPGMEPNIAKAKMISSSNIMIMIDPGFNFLSGYSTGTFKRDLEILLKTVKSTKGRIVIMFEFPVSPFRSNIFKIQRQLSEKYGVYLIPRHFLATVIYKNGNTDDCNFLTLKGNEEFADYLWNIIKNSIKQQKLSEKKSSSSETDNDNPNQ